MSIVVAACGSDTSDASGGAMSVCAAGQATGCRCADGALPGATGCATSQAGMSGGVAGSGASGTGGGRSTPAAVSGSAGRTSVAISGGAGSAGAAGHAGSAPTAGSPPMAAGGSGGAPSAGTGVAGAAGMAGTAGMPAADGGDGMDECAGGMMGKASNAGGSTGRGAGNVQLEFAAGNQIVRFQTTMEVPVKPNGNSTLFLWPGLEPLSPQGPIGTGVLQPVLTWGGSCAPGSPQSSNGKNWWISAQYVNTLGNDAGHKGCFGGDIMNVEIGEKLLIDMSLKGSVWSQTVTDLNTMKSVAFDEDLENQPQRWALFEIEMPTSTKPAADVVFTNTVITLEKPEAKSCQPSARGANDYYSAPVSSPDGLRCCIARLVLRASGVAATTMDPAP